MMTLKCYTQYTSRFGKQQWPQDWKRSVFTPILKKGNAKECSNYHKIVLISHVSKVIFKILQARRQQYMNRELPDVQARFTKGRGIRGQIVNIHWIIEKAKEFQKTSTSASLTMLNTDSVDHNKLWKILKEMRVSDHLTFLLRNLYVGQELIGRVRHRTTDWFKTGTGV